MLDKLPKKIGQRFQAYLNFLKIVNRGTLPFGKLQEALPELRSGESCLYVILQLPLTFPVHFLGDFKNPQYFCPV
ncbi:hypothetical protein BWI96_09880 [Siphonobacter sp. SORGH_AS_0500]|nr:hypothetical protein BWI96_09880 [Siphonobacter sp. SORGH_AS_0500]